MIFYMVDLGGGSRELPVGYTVKWPGEDFERVWSGTQWEIRATEFEGGDCWEEEAV